MMMISLDKNQKFVLKNFCIFGLIFLAIFFNMSVVPSLFNGKEQNIKSFKSMIGIGDLELNTTKIIEKEASEIVKY